MVTANGPDDGVCSWRAMQDGAHFIELVTPSTAMAPPSPSSTPKRGWLKSRTDIVGPRYPSAFHSGRFAVPRLRRLNRPELWWTLFSRSTDRRERKEKAVDSHVSDAPLDLDVWLRGRVRQ